MLGRNRFRITCMGAMEHTPAPFAVVNGQKVKPSVHFLVSTE